jgi:hypothetical protein
VSICGLAVVAAWTILESFEESELKIELFYLRREIRRPKEDLGKCTVRWGLLVTQ